MQCAGRMGTQAEPQEVAQTEQKAKQLLKADMRCDCPGNAKLEAHVQCFELHFPETVCRSRGGKLVECCEYRFALMSTPHSLRGVAFSKHHARVHPSDLVEECFPL